MMRSLLIRGMLVGLLAGILAFGLGKALGESQVNKAIAFEDKIGQLNHEPAEKVLVSRAVQASYGLGTATIVFGIAFGGIFAIVFAAAYGRLGTRTPRGTALLLAALALVAIYIVPNLKYPANPPSVGFHDTIGRRTALYVVMMALGVLTMLIAVGVRKGLTARIGEWNATIAAALGFVALIAVFYITLPGINEVPQQAIPGIAKFVNQDDKTLTFPPLVLWRFRIASLAIQTALWATLGVGFGLLAERYYRQQETTTAQATPASEPARAA